MKKLLPILVILVAVGAGGAVFYANRGEKEPTVTTLAISRGTIVDGVRATGTLQAVTTVTVGTQVSGIVQELGADFNSIVKKGQVSRRRSRPRRPTWSTRRRTWSARRWRSTTPRSNLPARRS